MSNSSKSNSINNNRISRAYIIRLYALLRHNSIQYWNIYKSESDILLDEEMVFVVCRRFKPSKSDRLPAINTREKQGNYRRSPWQHGASVFSALYSHQIVLIFTASPSSFIITSRHEIMFAGKRSFPFSLAHTHTHTHHYTFNKHRRLSIFIIANFSGSCFFWVGGGPGNCNCLTWLDIVTSLPSGI